ncbi:hypothetical protein FHS18_003756 [Paenibacillus phyllosphaerae]|uniref:Uncharacterized protein n=1 Tax=Paenibacillus phyllosphaerae TaxID=274593 RepID=A0A7W5FNY7_9BACL|nr:hypothetical protein [Paenibacillus phyllosphaerae]MBB3111688.1 hypothetical protein [Paenibacillus phyllosphaerae]
MTNINDFNALKYFKYLAIPILVVLAGGTFYFQAKTNQTIEAVQEHFAPCTDVEIQGAPANPSIVQACGKSYSVSVDDRWNPLRRVTVSEAVEQ